MNATIAPKSTTKATPPVLIAQQPPLTAVAKRAQQPLLTRMWSLPALLPKVPLVFPVAADLPPSPKQRYRSYYHYLGPEALLDPDRLAKLGDFEIALRLIDFSALEPELATIYVPSQKGQLPFHPVSMFLALLLRRQCNLSWQGLALLLAGEQGAGWRTLCGFQQGQTPSASGLRYFFQAVGPALYDDLCARLVRLLQDNALCPEHSTYPGDAPERGVTVSQDGQLRPARSRPSCQLANDACYHPWSSRSPRQSRPVSRLRRRAMPPSRPHLVLVGLARRAWRAAPATHRPAKNNAGGPAVWTPRHASSTTRAITTSTAKGRQGRTKAKGSTSSATAVSPTGCSTTASASPGRSEATSTPPTPTSAASSRRAWRRSRPAWAQ